MMQRTLIQDGEFYNYLTGLMEEFSERTELRGNNVIYHMKSGGVVKFSPIESLVEFKGKISRNIQRTVRRSLRENGYN